jgi:polar amino acid transport system substrate-binding protein
MRQPVTTIAILFLGATLSAAIAQSTKHAASADSGTTNSAPLLLSFNAAQVAHGRTAYLNNCAVCHGVDLGGVNGPALAGPDTKVSWGTGGGLWGYTTTQMPVGNAGGLSKSDYLNIVAYILQSNGQRPGTRAMTVPLIAGDETLVGGDAHR